MGNQRICKKCGCTDDNCSQCIEKTGHPCYWVTEDLCSACINEIESDQVTLEKYNADDLAC